MKYLVLFRGLLLLAWGFNPRRIMELMQNWKKTQLAPIQSQIEDLFHNFIKMVLVIMFKKIPLAWLQLIHQKVRLIVAIAGVIFAVVIVFMQLGIRDALFDSAGHLHKALK